MLFYGIFFFTAVSCGLAILQNQAVCGIQKFSGHFNTIGGFLMLFCVVFTSISEQFCSICNPITTPSEMVHVFHVDGQLIQV